LIDLFFLLILFIPKLGLITGLSITSCLLLLGSWLSNIISCYILAATILAFEHYFSWLSNIAPYTVFVAAPLLTFKYYFLLHFCCYTLGFPTQLPVFLLLRSRLSNITSYYVLAATLWGFQHNLRLRFCCEALVFPPQTRPIYACCCNAPDFLALLPLLPVGCCYAFDFQSLLPTTFLLLRSWLSNITSPLLLLRSWLSNITS
jgi:hypothetical protein